MSSSNDNVWQSLRLDPEVVETALDELDKAAATGVDRNRRSRRFRFRNEDSIVDVRQPGSVSPCRFRIITRDLSAGGLSFLHRGFLHAESKCTFIVIDRTGKPRTFTGTVVQSQYVANGAHLVSCRFDKGIYVADFCDQAEHRNVVVAIADKSVVRQLRSMLSVKRVSATPAEVDPETIYKELNSDTDGLVLAKTDYTKSIIDAIRAKGFLRAVIVVCDDPDANRTKLQSEGATMVIATLPDETEIEAVVSLLHNQPDPIEDTRMIA